MRCWQFDLRLTHPWLVASSLGPHGVGSKEVYETVFVELTDADGVVGLGEAAPSTRYGEDASTTLVCLQGVAPQRLSFEDLAGSRRYLEGLGAGLFAPRTALDVALVDGAARRAGERAHDLLGLPFVEGRHHTSFTIGLDRPEVIRQKVIEAEAYPVLKLKLGGTADRECLEALREVAPDKPVRVDANEAWKTKEEALRQIEWLAGDGQVQFVEQPMPADSDRKDMAWLKARSPLELMADESYRSALDAPAVAECYHAVNVKLVKTGGLHSALKALQTARQAGLKTMLGCMIESSLLITAAAHLAYLTDYLDLDGNLLITNDPYVGATSRHGLISLAELPHSSGLGVEAR